MVHRLLAQFHRDATGSATVEFVAIALPFFLIVLFVVEVTLAFFWWKSAEKATMLGARLAAVQNVAAQTLSNLAQPGDLPRNSPASNASIYGKYCSDASQCSPATNTTWICNANNTNCIAPNKNCIVRKMQSILAAIQPGNVEIAYRQIGLGYVGGPIIPAVTVRLTGLQFQTGFISIIGGVLGGPSLTTLPDISATVTGEDLNAGAGPACEVLP